METRELAKRAWYFGTQYKCTVCGAHTRTRKTFSVNAPVLREKDVIGGEYIERDDCPICYANRRSRLVFKFLRSRHLKAGASVLHVGPELAIYRHFFRYADVDYHAVDLIPTRHRDIPDVEKVDITDIPYPAKTFDLILCNHVLEHVPDDRKAMRELRRVLRDDGMALLQVPLGIKLAKTDEDPKLIDEKARERRFGQSDHVRIYAEQDYLARLKKAGFDVEILPISRFASYDELIRHQLNPRERLFIGRRAPAAKRTRPRAAAGAIAATLPAGVEPLAALPSRAPAEPAHPA